jgi:hypothetical protein
MVRSMRWGLAQPHGRGTAVQWNWLREKGAITPTAGGKYAIDVAKMKDGVRALATELLTIEGSGDFGRAERLLNAYGVSTPEIEDVKARLAAIPVDITPVFPAARER